MTSLLASTGCLADDYARAGIISTAKARFLDEQGDPFVLEH